MPLFLMTVSCNLPLPSHWTMRGIGGMKKYILINSVRHMEQRIKLYRKLYSYHTEELSYRISGIALIEYNGIKIDSQLDDIPAWYEGEWFIKLPYVNHNSRLLKIKGDMEISLK